MQDTLNELNKAVGVKGSMLMSDDGIVILSAIGPNLDEEVVAAMAGAIIRSTMRAVQAIGADGFSRFILTAEYGKMVFVDTGEAFLVVVTNEDINLDITMIEIASAVHKVANKSKIRLG